MNRYYATLILSSFFLIQCVQKKERDIASDPRGRVVTNFENRNSQVTKFETCNVKNNYLENQLANMSFEYFQKGNKSWEREMPMACIQFAQKNFQGSYAYCSNEEDKPKVGAPKPCLSENYTRLVYNAYNDVKNCFNMDPKRSFLQIMIESGFHVNAINKTGFDAGISQFTRNGILRVMDKKTERGILAKVEQLLLENSNPSCERISSVFRDLKDDAFKLEKRCSMIVLPQNPYRALVLHYLHTLRDQMDIKRVLEQRQEIKDLLNESITEQLVYMAYNRGIQGTLRLLDGYIADRKKNQATITADDLDLWKNLSLARQILKQEPYKRKILKSAKIKKLSFAEYALIHNQHYLGMMVDAQSLVQSKLGDLCF